MRKKEEIYSVNFFEININENIISILNTLLFGCCIIIFVYDLSNNISYEKMIRMLGKIENLENSNKILKIIIGNKTDLREDKNLSKLKKINYLISFKKNLNKKIIIVKKSIISRVYKF